MPDKISLQQIDSGFATTDLLNENFTSIGEYINSNSLSRVNPDDSADNAMGETLDMNGHPIINLPDAVSTSSPVSLRQFNAVLNGVEYAGTNLEVQTATASQTIFTLTTMDYWPGINNLAVYVNGERQAPSAYAETSSTVVTFGTGLNLNDEVIFVSNDLVAEVDVVAASNTQYTRGGTGSVIRSIQDRLQDTTSVEDFGADPTGAADSYAAFANALTASKSVYVPEGTYLLSQTLDLGDENDGVNLIGAGVDVTILKATHSAGPVLRIHERMQRIENMTVSASAARTAGSAGTNCGILFQPEDTFGHNCHDASLENVRIADQPWHGLVMAGAMFGCLIESCRIEDNLGHGVLIDNGTSMGMTNVSRPGSIEFHGGHVNDNTGHAFKVGDDDGSINLPLRILINNVDTFRNALTAGVRKTADAFWCYMEDSAITRCGFGCGNISAVPTVGALYLAGRDNRIDQPRLINPTQPPITIGSVTADGITSVGNIVTDITVSGMTANADPAVSIHADATENIVTSNRVTEVDSVATPSDRSEWQLSQEHFHHQEHYFQTLQSIKSRTIADEGFIDIEFDADPTFGVLLITANTPDRDYALVYFRLSSSTPACAIIAGSADATATTGPLNGTAGANGDLTISAHTDNKLYIENRTGSSGVYQFTFLNVDGGKILPAEMVE